MLYSPFTFLTYNKTKNIILKSNFLFFFWTPVSYITFSKVFNTCSLKNFFFKFFFKVSNIYLGLLTNSCNVVYTYQNKFKFEEILNQTGQKNFIFGVYKNFFFYTTRTRISQSAYCALLKINPYFSQKLFNLNQL